MTMGFTRVALPVAVASLLFGAACETDVNRSVPPTHPRPDAAIAGDALSDTGPSDSIDGGAPLDGSPSDGEANDAGSDGGRADAAISTDAGGMAPLWPMAVGNRWTYSVTGICAGTLERVVLSAQPVAGRPSFQLSGCNGIVGNFSLPGGDEV